MSGPSVLLVRGLPDDAQELSALALRSKGYWGYDAAFLDACRKELTLTAQQASTARVARLGDSVAGFVLLADHPDGLAGAGELLMLFVDPPYIGRGVGAALLADAIATAAARGWSWLRIESDPGAEDFYLSHGARRVGVARSGSIAGRQLPLLELPVEAS